MEEIPNFKKMSKEEIHDWILWAEEYGRYLRDKVSDARDNLKD